MRDRLRIHPHGHDCDTPPPEVTAAVIRRTVDRLRQAITEARRG